MKSCLMIIESPNKIKTISKYLSDTNIKIMATIGHIRELNSKKYRGLGFDRTTYDTDWIKDSEKKIKGKKVDIIEEINKEASKCDQIYLSTDPDREGEAISWHIKEILTEQNKKKCLRVVFNEITKPAIEQALKHPRDLDQNQINSYLARKLLDRGLGFQLSWFVNQTASGGKSAGRVQSIALKFLKDKDLEIKQFVPDHWFNLKVFLKNGLELTLKKLSNFEEFEIKKIPNNSFINFAQEEQIKKFKESLSQEYELISISDSRKETTKSPAPFKTSTLQSSAINRLNMSAKVVDRTAQTLYEGLEIDGEFISLITYPRTDREDLSETFISDAKDYLINNFGQKYWKGQIKNKSKKTADSNFVQGAHEAIRPTYLNITPEQLIGKVGESEYKLYSLIWIQAMSSLMSDAEYENVLYSFENNKNVFTVNFREEKFDGYKVLIRKYFPKLNVETEKFPKNLEVGKKYEHEIVEIKKVDKAPPAPYTEASLIGALESKGIGRPSTYSHMVNIVLERDYARKESGKLHITELGLQMSDILEKNFPTIMQYDYTKNMEQNLDNISENKLNWKSFLDGVFDLFEEEMKKAKEFLPELKDSGKICDLCGGKMLYKISKKNKTKFLGCSNYPSCNNIENLDKKELNENCPECDSVLVEKKNKWGKYFVSCSNYPKCKYIKRDENYFFPEKLDRNCPKCDCILFKKKSKYGTFFISCSGFPKCKYIESLNNVESEFLNEECPDCHNVLVKIIRKKPYIKCSNKDCKYTTSF